MAYYQLLLVIQCENSAALPLPAGVGSVVEVGTACRHGVSLISLTVQLHQNHCWFLHYCVAPSTHQAPNTPKTFLDLVILTFKL